MSDKPIASKTRELLGQHGIRLKKSLGQNFLTDLNVLDKIIRAAELTESSGVIEIGPGMGALTERLADHSKKVVAIEIDQRLIPVLKELFKNHPHVEIVQGDALTIDFSRLIHEHLSGLSSLHLVANLPYYVTSPILIRVLELQLPLKNLVVMVQKEVADRLTAQPGTKDYGSLTVFVQYYAKASMVAKVPSHVFVPRPQVDSAVVKMTLHPKPIVDVSNESLFFQIVRAAFHQRRKTLLNALHSQVLAHMSKAEIETWIQKANIDPKRRGETLSLQEFAILTQVMDQQGAAQTRIDV
jgi:16S rRNA (adenine1518-N6/adenine1519-N6)-dimethyltransferase